MTTATKKSATKTTQKVADLTIGRVKSDLMENAVPDKDPGFVEYGCFGMIARAISTKRFFVHHIVGESGNGKTTMVEQACASENRELIVVQVTKATKETELFGDFRLVNGETPFYYGPVAEAMRRGAVLLLDELTQGDSLSLMCLQNVLAGKPVLIKKTGELIKPQPGFCVVSTGNSIGEGDESSEDIYAGEENLNEAFRDRITAVHKHSYPPAKIEVEILKRQIAEYDEDAEDFVINLVRWANITRKSYAEGLNGRQITTRRLLHIISNFELFEDRLVSIDLALNRFPTDVFESFRQAYVVIDSSVSPQRMNISPDDMFTDDEEADEEENKF